MEKKQMYTFFAIVAALLVVLFIVKNGKSNSLKIEELIPNEVKNYFLDGKEISSNVESVKVDRQDTEGDSNITYCEITLKDEYMTRIAYVCLNLRHYDNGGWTVESFNQYEDEVIQDINENKIKEVVENKLKELEYTNFELNSSTKDVYNSESGSIKGASSYDGNPYVLTYNYNINEITKHLNITGSLKYTVLFGYKYGSNYYTLAKEYPISYSTSLIHDFSNLKGTWNIDGSWNGKIERGENDYIHYNKINLELSNSASSKVNWKGTIITLANSSGPNEVTTSGEGTIKLPSEVDFLKDTKDGYDTKKTECKISEITAYTDDTMSIKEKTGMGEEYRIYDLYLKLSPNEITVNYQDLGGSYEAKLEKIN